MPKPETATSWVLPFGTETRLPARSSSFVSLKVLLATKRIS